MTDQHPQAQGPLPMPTAGHLNPDARPVATPSSPQMPTPPPVPAAERARLAARRRDETDYIFHFWSALGRTILTFGIYGFYVFYQLIRRMRDHNTRRLELLDAATAVAWEQAGRRGLQQELTPAFERAGGHLTVLRQMTGEFREPVIWRLLAIVARGIVEIIGFVLPQAGTEHGTPPSAAANPIPLLSTHPGPRPQPSHPRDRQGSLI